MSARAWIALGALLAAALVHGCANDSGNPKQPPIGTIGPGGMIPFAGAPAPPPGAAPTMPMGGGGMVAAKPTAPACMSLAQSVAGGIVSEQCVECTCRVDSAAASQCSTECWKLLQCGTTRCMPDDVSCLLASCSLATSSVMAAIAGAVDLQSAFMDCAAFCVADVEVSEGGLRPVNDL